jgi:CheY-like chemotaxis protein
MVEAAIGLPSKREATMTVTCSEPIPLKFHSRHILIVEDNPDGRETLQVLLGLMGHRPEAAADGAEGVALGLAIHPEVALIDIGLPRLDGYQVAQRLRAAFGEDILLVACTAYGGAADRQRAWDAGFDGYLVKPLDLDELARWLNEGM